MKEVQVITKETPKPTLSPVESDASRQKAKVKSPGPGPQAPVPDVGQLPVPSPKQIPIPDQRKQADTTGVYYCKCILPQQGRTEGTCEYNDPSHRVLQFVTDYGYVSPTMPADQCFILN